MKNLFGLFFYSIVALHTGCGGISADGYEKGHDRINDGMGDGSDNKGSEDTENVPRDDKRNKPGISNRKVLLAIRPAYSNAHQYTAALNLCELRFS